MVPDCGGLETQFVVLFPLETRSETSRIDGFNSRYLALVGVFQKYMKEQVVKRRI